MVKLFLRYVLAILIIMPYYSSAMDFDKENGIPLEALSAIYQKTSIKTTEPKSADQQFADFEQKIDREYKSGFFREKSIHFNDYFTRAQQEAPAIIANDEMVKKFSLIEKSFFAKSIEYFIAQTQSHYRNVTCDTLPIINNPHVSQPSLFLNTLPHCVRTHIMHYAYEKINRLYTVVTLARNHSSCSIRNKTHIAAVTNNDDGTFQIWDLKTGASRTLPKKSISGDAVLNTNGSQLVTATLAQKEPTIIDLDIWDCQTGSITHTIYHSERIAEMTLIHQDDHTSKLIIFDAAGDILIYTIRTNTDPILSENLNAHLVITNICHKTESLHGEYSLDYNNRICKNCPAYYLCSQAIENTFAKDSLPKIKTAMLYLSLTPLEKDLIEKKIQERTKTLMEQEQQQKTFLSWFG